MKSTAEFHHQIADALPPQADTVFDDTTTFDTTVDMFDPQPAVMQRPDWLFVAPVTAPVRVVS